MEVQVQLKLNDERILSLGNDPGSKREVVKELLQAESHYQGKQLPSKELLRRFEDQKCWEWNQMESPIEDIDVSHIQI